MATDDQPGEGCVRHHATPLWRVFDTCRETEGAGRFRISDWEQPRVALQAFPVANRNPCQERASAWEGDTYLNHTSSLSARSPHVCYRKSSGSPCALASTRRSARLFFLDGGGKCVMHRNAPAVCGTPRRLASVPIC